MISVQREPSKYPVGTKVVGTDGETYVVRSLYYEGGCFLDRTEGEPKDAGCWGWGSIALYDDSYASLLKPLEAKRKELRRELNYLEHHIEALLLIAKSTEIKGDL